MLTIKTKNFGDIKVDPNADWGSLSPYEDVGFAAGDHLYCYVYMRDDSSLGYYVTTAYGSQRELENGCIECAPEPDPDEKHDNR